MARIPVSRSVRWPVLGALGLLDILAPVYFIHLFAAAGPQATLIVFLFVCAMVACALDLRYAVILADDFATLIEQAGGRLTIELSALLFWMTGIAIILWWRSAWKGWRPLPSEVA